ncbi:S49 family peptidase [Celeribacter sp.]|uniref:S49 family peptidase n=1 Tax=Celeribacter sp. TaxID=1890673 RepID=UPI003A931DAF
MNRLVPFRKSPPRVNVVRLHGAVTTRRGGLNDVTLAPVIERAFRKGKPAAVALSINSPGGSPVQSSLIGARIARLAKEKGVRVYAFIEDVAASGGYWIACAADEIFADHSSIIGSIGVISAGFGFDDFISRHGIARRVYTSGGSKSQLDPFRPENPDDVARLKDLQGDVHEAFIAHVKKARGETLSTDVELFDGSFWTGQRAVDLGLADGIDHLVPHMKHVFGDKVRLSVFGPRQPFLTRFGASISEGAVLGVEERVQWARFGL